MRRAAFVGIALVAGIALTGCDSAQDVVRKNTEETVIQYEGADLHCIASAYDRSASLTCDFVRFHEENPSLP